MRIKYRIKLPDAIIISSAIITGSSLITDDKQLHFVDDIQVIKTF